MKYILYILFLLPLLVQAQENLVPNPGFEDRVNCPFDVNMEDEVFSCDVWRSSGGTPDYFNRCSKNTLFGKYVVSVPSNIIGNQEAASGDAYCGLITFEQGSDWREFIGIKLKDTLVKGTKYYVHFKISRADSSNFASNNLSALFTTKPFQYVSSSVPVNIHPQILDTSIVYDVINWTTISGSFIADSAYGYITIGNFFSNLQTNKIYIGNTSLNFNCSYYYIDDICISTSPVTCELINDTEPHFDRDKITFYPNPSGDIFSFNSNDTCNLTIGLYNMLGERKKEVMNCEENSIDVSDVPPGVYVIVIRKGLKFLQGEKVIVIH